MKRELKYILFFCIVMNFIPSVVGLRNPSLVYCEALGYNYVVEQTDEGELGICQFPDGSNTNAWDFLEGKTHEEYSYCNQEGYGMKIISDSDKCDRLFSEECAVCLLPDGTEVEVTELMNLTFEETTCGDGSCGLPENYQTCPQDCPSGSYDGYCDGIEDNICDQDCVDQRISGEDSDCPFCGDGICGGEENYQNCPQDCPKPAICGDGICDPNENQDNCCSDCGCSEGMKCVEKKCVSDRCGNNACEIDFGENYKTCSNDCPSGSKDSYCDGVTDGRCDPDCTEEEDIDCIKSRSNLLIYGIIFAVVVILISVIIIKSRRET